MQDFVIPAISCGHCSQAVTQAVHRVDPAAQVLVDVPTRKVQVHSTLPRAVLAQTLQEAGYTPD